MSSDRLATEKIAVIGCTGQPTAGCHIRLDDVAGVNERSREALERRSDVRIRSCVRLKSTVPDRS